MQFAPQIWQNLFAGLCVAIAIAVSLWWRRRKHPWRSTGLPLLLVAFFATLGFSASLPLLNAGGRQVVMFLALATADIYRSFARGPARIVRDLDRTRKGRTREGALVVSRPRHGGRRGGRTAGQHPRRRGLRTVPARPVRRL